MYYFISETCLNSFMYIHDMAFIFIYKMDGDTIFTSSGCILYVATSNFIPEIGKISQNRSQGY